MSIKKSMSILKYQSVQLFGAKLINFIAVIVILFTVSVKMSHVIKHQYHDKEETSIY